MGVNMNQTKVVISEDWHKVMQKALRFYVVSVVKMLVIIWR